MTLPNLKPTIYKLFFNETPKLPGWAVRMSGSRLYDPLGHETESGIEPTDGYVVDLDPEAVANGIDNMLEAAIEAIYRFYDSDSDTEG